MLIISLPLMVFGAGSCPQTATEHPWGDIDVTFVCTGDADNGSVPTLTVDADTMGKITGKLYFFNVLVYPTSGGTAPDAADITVNMRGQDLLGAKGVNLIHATATQDTAPYSAFMTSYRYPSVIDTITVAVANQATASANYTIVLQFRR